MHSEQALLHEHWPAYILLIDCGSFIPCMCLHVSTVFQCNVRRYKDHVPESITYLLKLELTEKDRLHTMQPNGLAPVCMCECTARAEGLVKRFWQTAQNCKQDCDEKDEGRENERQGQPASWVPANDKWAWRASETIFNDLHICQFHLSHCYCLHLDEDPSY